MPNPVNANRVPNSVLGSGTASAGRASSSRLLDLEARELFSSGASSGSSNKSPLIPAKSTASELLSSKDSSGSSSKSALMPPISALFSLLEVEDNSGSSSKSLLMPAKFTWF